MGESTKTMNTIDRQIDARIGHPQMGIDNGPEFDPSEEEVMERFPNSEDDGRTPFLLFVGAKLSEVHSAFPMAYCYCLTGVVAIRVKL